jgi:hypothetical protein
LHSARSNNNDDTNEENRNPNEDADITIGDGDDSKPRSDIESASKTIESADIKVKDIDHQKNSVNYVRPVPHLKKNIKDNFDLKRQHSASLKYKQERD